MSNKLGKKYIRVLKNKIVVNFTRDGRKINREFFYNYSNKNLIMQKALDYRNSEYLKSNKNNTGIRHISLIVADNKLYLTGKVKNFTTKHIIKEYDDIINVINKVVYDVVNELGFCNRVGVNTINECEYRGSTLKDNLKYNIITNYSRYLEKGIYKVILYNSKVHVVITTTPDNIPYILNSKPIEIIKIGNAINDNFLETVIV